MKSHNGGYALKRRITKYLKTLKLYYWFPFSESVDQNFVIVSAHSITISRWIDTLLKYTMYVYLRAGNLFQIPDVSLDQITGGKKKKMEPKFKRGGSDSC